MNGAYIHLGHEDNNPCAGLFHVSVSNGHIQAGADRVFHGEDRSSLLPVGLIPIDLLDHHPEMVVPSPGHDPEGIGTRDQVMDVQG